MATEKFLGETQLAFLLAQLNAKMAEKIMEAVTNKANVINVTGPIVSVTPAPNTIYLQKDDALDPTWTMYYHDGAAWIPVGSGSGGSGTSWDKTELEAMTEADITAIINGVFGTP